jgi:hypothetical protein
MDITTATPVEIDTELYRLDGEAAKAARSLSLALVLIHRAVGDDKTYRKPDYDLTHEQAVEQAQAKAGTKGDFLAAAEKALVSLEQARAAVAAVADQVRPLEAKYNRRPWTRAFLALVNGNGGHVHSSTECSTCHNGKHRTLFARQPQYSGADEATIVADAGYRACTVCYKDAPVEATPETHPTKIFSEDEILAQAAREERATAKAARDATRVAKALTPDGSELVVTTRHGSEHFRTEQAATNWVVNEIGSHRAWGYSLSQDGIDIVIQAIATKRGRDVSTVRDEIEVKVIKWIRRNR